MANSLNEAFAKLQLSFDGFKNAILCEVGLTVNDPIEYPNARKIEYSPLIDTGHGKYLSRILSKRIYQFKTQRQIFINSQMIKSLN